LLHSEYFNNASNVADDEVWTEKEDVEMCPVDVQDGLRLPNFRRDSLEDFVGFSDRMSVGFTSKVVLIAMAMNKAYDELDPELKRHSFTAFLCVLEEPLDCFTETLHKTARQNALLLMEKIAV
jgi:hypothetical protein